MKPRSAPSRTPPQIAAIKRPPPAAPVPAKRPRWWLRIAGVAIVVASTIAALSVLQQRPGDLCRHWETEACTADEERAKTILVLLDRYGKFGLPAVVRLLDAPKPATAETARDLLLTRFRRLRSSEVVSDDESLATIADELHKLVHRSSGPLPQTVVDTALELLETTGELSIAERIDGDVSINVLAACDEVLRHAPVERPRSIVDVALFKLPPARAAQAIKLIEEEHEREEQELEAAAEMLITSPVATAPQELRALPPIMSAESPRSAANSAARVNPIRATPDHSAVQTASLDASMPTGDDLRRVNAWTLFAHLHDANKADVLVTVQELTRRKFTPREMELGQHLTSDDPIERRRYTALLTSLAGVDAKPWLLKMATDEDSDVRFEAVSIMATSNDPELLAAVRDMSHSDPDLRVRQTADRAMSTTVR